MEIVELIWPRDRIEHIARHRVEPAEVNEVCFGAPLALRAPSSGDNPVYYVLGPTEEDRLLFCVVIQFPGGKGYPVTARDMTPQEKRRYRNWKRR